jgi:glucosamine kinase
VSLYVAGIDGGQSSTTAVIGDELGRIVGRGTAGPADEVGQGADSTRLHDALTGALAGAVADAGLEPGAHFGAIVAGISGYEGRLYGRTPVLPATRVVYMHDAPVAHAGALGGRPGAIVIAGTGSVVYATDGRQGRTTGGWGFLFGDEGSAFWLVREALAAAMRDDDAGSGAMRAEAQAACEFFGLPSLRAITRAFYAGEIGRDRLAAFAPRALQFECWAGIAGRGADRLAALVRSALERGAVPLVACTGGMFADAGFARRVHDGIRQAAMPVEIVDPRYSPSMGALLLAYREAGIPVGAMA